MKGVGDKIEVIVTNFRYENVQSDYVEIEILHPFTDEKVKMRCWADGTITY